MAKRRKGPSLAGTVKQYLNDHPEWLASADTSELVAQFQKDHPGTPVDKRLMQSIYNVKSTMRKGETGFAKRQQSKANARQVVASAQLAGTPRRPLSMLEEQIDDCMILAKQIGKDQMHNVLGNLHRARNAVVVMLEA